MAPFDARAEAAKLATIVLMSEGDARDLIASALDAAHARGKLDGAEAMAETMRAALAKPVQA